MKRMKRSINGNIEWGYCPCGERAYDDWSNGWCNTHGGFQWFFALWSAKNVKTHPDGNGEPAPEGLL